MDFRTEIKAEAYSFDISYRSKVLFLGSCFSDNISQKLINGGFSITANPFGVLYNPISINNAFDMLLEEKSFDEKDLIQNNGLYHSFSHHGSFSKKTKEETLNLINNKIKENSDLLETVNVVFITFGTAYVYRYLKTQEIVSNCHKISEKEFEHFALTIEEIVSIYKILLDKLKSKNSNIKIIFTVSPIRHWKDGAHGNQLSKATLHLAIFELQKQFDFVYYYPSYEIIMDDLRDYRFYADNMIHINSQAINYIYQHFRKSFYSDKTKSIEQQVLKLKQAQNHRPFNSETKEHRNFIQKTKQKIEQLLLKYPEINI